MLHTQVKIERSWDIQEEEFICFCRFARNTDAIFIYFPFLYQRFVYMCVLALVSIFAGRISFHFVRFALLWHTFRCVFSAPLFLVFDTASDRKLFDKRYFVLLICGVCVYIVQVCILQMLVMTICRMVTGNSKNDTYELFIKER